MLIKNGQNQKNVATLRAVDGIITTESLDIAGTRLVCEAIDEGLGGWKPEDNLHLEFTSWEFKCQDGVSRQEYHVNSTLVIKWERTKEIWRPGMTAAVMPPPSVPAPAPIPSPVTPPPTPVTPPPSPIEHPVEADSGATAPSRERVMGWQYQGTMDGAPQWILDLLELWPAQGGLEYSITEGVPKLRLVILGETPTDSASAIVVELGEFVYKQENGNVLTATAQFAHDQFEFVDGFGTES